MGKEEVEQFLTSLAVDRQVSAATQNQALHALLFLYREVLAQELGWLTDMSPPNVRSDYLPYSRNKRYEPYLVPCKACPGLSPICYTVQDCD